MSDELDKQADQPKKVRRRTGDGDSLSEADEEKTSAVAGASVEPSVATPAPSRTPDKPAKKAAGIGAQNLPGSAGQAARMRFRRDRRPKR